MAKLFTLALTGVTPTHWEGGNQLPYSKKAEVEFSLQLCQPHLTDISANIFQCGPQQATVSCLNNLSMMSIEPRVSL